MARWINMLQSKHCQSNYLWLFNKNYLLKVEVLVFSNKEHFQHVNFGQNKLRRPHCCVGANNCTQFKLEIAS